MIVLGIDPGTRHNAWALVDTSSRVLLDRGCVTGPPVATRKRPGVTWARALASITAQLRLRIAEFQPDAVGIERTQHALSQSGRTEAQVLSQAVNTARTEEVVREVAVACALLDVPLVHVHPASSAAALRVPKGATDRQVVEAAAAMFGGEWLVRDAHEARAAGVALRVSAVDVASARQAG